MSIVVDASLSLIAKANELDAISKALVTVENRLEILEPQYEDSIEAYVAELWETCLQEERKFPPQDVRTAMAKKAVPQDLKDEYRTLIRRRAKTKARLSDLREIVAAQRSIVSAAKTELEASEGPQPAWTS